MKNLLQVSVFAMGVVFSSGAMAATGTGEAQAELSNPLIVANTQNVVFGTVAIDPSAGPQDLVMNVVGTVACPGSYSCSGSTSRGLISITGAPNTAANMSIVGSTATLSDGAGNTLIFDPTISGSDTQIVDLSSGSNGFYITGTLSFTGNEPAGTYNTTNAGGSGYQVTVNYQ